MSKIKLILADDHPLIRAGFKSLLGRSDKFEIVAEASNGRELLHQLSQLNTDAVLVDITMPEMSGLEVLSRLKTEKPALKVIILTMHEEPEYILNAMKAGADGYLLKNIDSAELEKALTTIHAGGRYLSAHVAGILADSALKPAPEKFEITAREKEVLVLVAAGNSTKQIASKLDISIRTVETHRINLLKKVNVGNSAELIKKAIEQKLI